MSKELDPSRDIVDCTVSLCRACAESSRAIPGMDMPLGDFIGCYGTNGVRFTAQLKSRYVRTNIPGHAIEVEFDTMTGKFQFLEKNELASYWRNCLETSFVDERGEVVE